MAHDSFENDDVAALMNEHFVNIKVDREERPDIDAVYIEAVSAMTGHAGWPMTCFLTADGAPFYAGTFFPRAQFSQLLICDRPTCGATTARARWMRASRSLDALGELSGRTGAGTGFDIRCTRHRGGPARRHLRLGPWRIRGSAEVPAVDGARVLVPRARTHRRADGAADGGGHLRGDGPRWHI